jgi:hypothetical protein
LMNATRSQPVSLYIRSTVDVAANGWAARGNYPGQ